MATVSSPSAPPQIGGDPISRFATDDMLYEVVDNEIRELPPMGVKEKLVAATFMRTLSGFA
jgi:hypothetical protein